MVAPLMFPVAWFLRLFVLWFYSLQGGPMFVTQQKRRSLFSLLVAVLLASLPTLQLADSKLKKSQEADAHALLQAARDHREVLGANFPGFRGRLRIRLDEDQYSGSLLFRPPNTVEVKLENKEVLRSVEQTLRSMIFHRVPPPKRNAGQPKHELTLAPPGSHRLGRKVFLGGPYQSSYRIRDNQILEVDRQMGDGHLVITVLENRVTPDGRHLPRHFLVTLFDGETGALKSASAVTDEYIEVKGNFVPQRRQTTRAKKGGTENLDILIEKIELLEAVTLTSSTE